MYVESDSIIYVCYFLHGLVSTRDTGFKTPSSRILAKSIWHPR